jgi:hypothetical protein
MLTSSKHAIVTPNVDIVACLVYLVLGFFRFRLHSYPLSLNRDGLLCRYVQRHVAAAVSCSKVYSLPSQRRAAAFPPETRLSFIGALSGTAFADIKGILRSDVFSHFCSLAESWLP